MSGMGYIPTPYNKTHVCEECGGDYQATAPSQVCCPGACRQARNERLAAAARRKRLRIRAQSRGNGPGTNYQGLGGSLVAHNSADAYKRAESAADTLRRLAERRKPAAIPQPSRLGAIRGPSLARAGKRFLA